MRKLAGELTIAPNTVVKAYNELQRLGLVESRPVVGTMVAADPGEAVHEQQIEDLYQRLGELVCDAVGLGITEDELWERFDAEFERFHRRTASRQKTWSRGRRGEDLEPGGWNEPRATWHAGGPLRSTWPPTGPAVSARSDRGLGPSAR